MHASVKQLHTAHHSFTSAANAPTPLPLEEALTKLSSCTVPAAEVGSRSDVARLFRPAPAARVATNAGWLRTSSAESFSPGAELAWPWSAASPVDAELKAGGGRAAVSSAAAGRGPAPSKPGVTGRSGRVCAVWLRAVVGLTAATGSRAAAALEAVGARVAAMLRAGCSEAASRCALLEPDSRALKPRTLLAPCSDARGRAALPGCCRGGENSEVRGGDAVEVLQLCIAIHGWRSSSAMLGRLRGFCRSTEGSPGDERSMIMGSTTMPSASQGPSLAGGAQAAGRRTLRSAAWMKSRAACDTPGGTHASCRRMHAYVSSRVSRSKGGRPTSSSYASTPTAHTSTDWLYPSSERSCCLGGHQGAQSRQTWRLGRAPPTGPSPIRAGAPYLQASHPMQHPVHPSPARPPGARPTLFSSGRLFSGQSSTSGLM